MKTITVYRIEHPDTKTGFLRHPVGEKTEKLHQIRRNHNDFPSPFEENLEIINGLHKCAFKTLTEMLNSVGVRDIKYLVRTYGFRVYEMVVNSNQIGERQVLFTNRNVIQSKNITNQFR